jgi:Zn-dependent protease
MNLDFANAFVWFTAFLFSTTVHEAMHAFVAWRLGDPTAYNGGQVTLSPVPHVAREPIGMLVLPLLTSFTQGWAVGWASAPYDPHWAERYPKRAAVMAAAGPAGNFLIAFAVLAVLKTCLAVGVFVAPDTVSFDSVVETAGGATFMTTALSVLLVLNIFLGIFNLLPLPPLDGSAVFSLALPDRHRTRLREVESNPAISMLGLFIAWQVFPMVTDPLFSTLLWIVHPGEAYS